MNVVDRVICASRYKYLIARLKIRGVIIDNHSNVAINDHHQFIARMHKVIPLLARGIDKQSTGITQFPPVTCNLTLINRGGKFISNQSSHSLFPLLARRNATINVRDFRQGFMAPYFFYVTRPEHFQFC